MKKFFIIVICMFILGGVCVFGQESTVLAAENLGDMDSNEKIDLRDASFVLKIAVGIVEADSNQKYVADVNSDGKVNLQDAQLVLKKAVGIIRNYDDVTVEKVTISKSSATLGIGESLTLTAAAYPTNAVNKSIKWSSSDRKVATVSDGVVKAVGAGTATITASAGGHSAQCVVTVKDMIVISGYGDKVVKDVSIPSGIYKVTGYHQGRSNFAVFSYNADGTSYPLFFNEIGNYTGSIVSYQELTNGYLEIKADRDWRITISKIENGATSNLTGYGDCVSPYFTLPSGVQIVNLNYVGKSNFAVIVIDEFGHRYYLANKIGNYSGQTIFNDGKEGTKYCIQVIGEGKWSVDFGLGESVTFVGRE